MRQILDLAVRSWWILALGLALRPVIVLADEPASLAKVKLRDRREVQGRLEGSAETGFRVRLEDGPTVPLDEVESLDFEPASIDPALGSPPFHARMGLGGQISGRLDGVDETSVRLLIDSGTTPLKIRRAGVKALVQRPGETQVIREDFETFDTMRWPISVGNPSVDGERVLVGTRSLKLPSGGSAITARLADPIGSGRLEVAYWDGGQVVEDQRWFLDLTFHTKIGDQATIRAVPGWTDETVAVESPGGPGLAVQRLLRHDGWHRLSVRFGSESTKLAIDGYEMAHGPGTDAELVEIRLATESLGNERPDPELAVRFDDLSLVRFGEPSGRLEVEPSADEVRFSTGDQLFGRVPSASPEGVEIRLDPDQPALWIAWSKVAGVHFRRQPAPSEPIDGLFARVEWRAGPGDNPRDLDSAEGALRAVSADEVALEVPYVGTLRVPRNRLTRIEPGASMRRLVIDPTAHHLGNDRREEPKFDPPQAEPGPLEIGFDLESVPPRPARLALDVVDVVGVSGNLQFSEDVRQGKYRTHLKLNGQALDDLNTAVTSSNATEERVYVAIPPDRLREGRNVLRIEQDADEERDNLELLGVAVEWPIEKPARTNQP